VQALGLLNSPPTLDYLRAHGVSIIDIEPGQPTIKYYSWLYDRGNEDLIDPKKHFAVVPDGDNWHVVQKDESVVFVDKNTGVY
jgi:hypothetical protein